MSIKLYDTNDGKSVYRIPKLSDCAYISWDAVVEGWLMCRGLILYKGQGATCPRVWVGFTPNDFEVCLPQTAEPPKIRYSSDELTVKNFQLLDQHFYDAEARMLYFRGDVYGAEHSFLLRRTLNDMKTWYYQMKNQIAIAKTRDHEKYARAEKILEEMKIAVTKLLDES